MLNVGRKWKILLPGCLALFLLLTLGQRFSSFLQYDRSLILAGEYWRIITCHFTHTGWPHLLLNMAGALLVFALFFRLYSPLSWLLGSVCCMVGIGLSLLVFSPDLTWYRGLSGLLHGLLLMGLIGGIRKGETFYWVGLLALVGKLAMEQLVGPSGHTVQLIHAPVITNAHLAGVIAGGIAASVILFATRTVQKIPVRLTAGPAA